MRNLTLKVLYIFGKKTDFICYLSQFSIFCVDVFMVGVKQNCPRYKMANVLKLLKCDLLAVSSCHHGILPIVCKFTQYSLAGSCY